MKILFFSNTTWNLYNYRLPLMKELRSLGHDVFALSPKDRFSPHLVGEGFQWRDIKLSQYGLNPFVELGTLVRICRFYRETQPDIISHFTVKSVLYGSIASKFIQPQRVINNITGLGQLFSEQRQLYRVLRFFLLLIYRFVLRGTMVIFQNPEDRDLFLSKNIITPAQSCLIRGSGVVIPEDWSEHPVDSEAIQVILPGRIMRSKGVEVFMQAAKRIRQTHPQISFALVGSISEDDPTAFSQKKLDKWQKEGLLAWWGWRDDMAKVYKHAHIVCLPTLYGEGLPKSLLEAAACSRPIIGTDTPGCREIIQHGNNGLLVPTNDVNALIEAITTLAESEDLRVQMGQAGQQLVRKHFSVEKIVKSNLVQYLPPLQK